MLLAIATAEDVKAVLDLLKSISTFMLTSVGDVLDLVMAQPLIIIPIGVVMLHTVISNIRSFF